MTAIGRNPEQGWNGLYFTDPGQLGQRSKQASGTALGDSLWRLSEKMIRDVVGEDALVDWNSS